MTIALSKAASLIEPFRAMEIVASAGELEAAGDDVVMMCVGQPSAPAPLKAREAAIAAIEKGRIGYTSSPGMAPLRKRIARHYQDAHGIDIDWRRVIVTTGSSAGFMLAFLALFDTGSSIAIPSPGYPAYRNILQGLSLRYRELETNAASRWAVTPQLLEKANEADRLHGLLIANPNNPNGTMIEPEAFQALMSTAAELGITFISDEIYHGLTYGISEFTALQHESEAIVINSFSKYFCMTGWRIGWMVVPEHLVGHINRLQQNLFICAPEVSQIAALHAFDGTDELEKTKAGYLANRAYLLDRLPALGFREIQPADGAFYVYADASGLTNDSEQFCRDVLSKAKVALTPGTDFDTRRGARWVRISYAGSMADMENGVERLGNLIA